MTLCTEPRVWLDDDLPPRQEADRDADLRGFNAFHH